MIKPIKYLINKFFNFKRRLYLLALKKTFRLFKINFWYNEKIKTYKKGMYNVAIFTESPWHIKKYGLESYDKLDCLISTYKFGNCEKYINASILYSGVDCFCSSPASDMTFQKNKLCSHIMSNKNDSDGHKLRHSLAKFISAEDLYGFGTNKPIHDKSTALERYMFSLVIENTYSEEYVSEKLFDAIKWKVVPIYYGPIEMLSRFGFDVNGIIHIKDLQNAKVVVETLSPKIYYDKIEYVEKNFKILQNIRLNMKNNFFVSIVAPLYFRKEIGSSNVLTKFNKSNYTDV